MVGAEAAEGGRGSTKHVKELKLHPLMNFNCRGAKVSHIRLLSI